MSQAVQRFLCSGCLGRYNQNIRAAQSGRVGQNSHWNRELGQAGQGQTVLCNLLGAPAAGQHCNRMPRPDQVPADDGTEGAWPKNCEFMLTMRSEERRVGKECRTWG